MSETIATMPHATPAKGEAANARERLLRAASELFCRYGINATGVDAIVQAAGTAKATLYKTFGSKEALIEAVLVSEGEVWRDWYIAAIEEYPGDAGDKLAGALQVLEGWFATERFFGCPFINAVGEFDKKDARYRNIALAHKSVVLARLVALATEAGAKEPEALAHQIGILIDGAIVAAMVTRNPAVALHAHAAAECVVRSATISDGARRLERP